MRLGHRAAVRRGLRHLGRAAADGALAAGALEPGTVLVLLDPGTAIERVRTTQALADAHPDAYVVVAMPDDRGQRAYAMQRACRGAARSTRDRRHAG